jgi:hypothetical protein
VLTAYSGSVSDDSLPIGSDDVASLVLGSDRLDGGGGEASGGTPFVTKDHSLCSVTSFAANASGGGSAGGEEQEEGGSDDLPATTTALYGILAAHLASKAKAKRKANKEKASSSNNKKGGGGKNEEDEGKGKLQKPCETQEEILAQKQETTTRADYRQFGVLALQAKVLKRGLKLKRGKGVSGLRCSVLIDKLCPQLAADAIKKKRVDETRKLPVPSTSSTSVPTPVPTSSLSQPGSVLGQVGSSISISHPSTSLLLLIEHLAVGVHLV